MDAADFFARLAAALLSLLLSAGCSPRPPAPAFEPPFCQPICPVTPEPPRLLWLVLPP